MHNLLAILIFGVTLNQIMCETPIISCVRTFEYSPVCGEDGKVYGNESGAKCKKVAVKYRCPADTWIDNEPACGEDGKVYMHKCAADCAGVKIQPKNECDMDKGILVS